MRKRAPVLPTKVLLALAKAEQLENQVAKLKAQLKFRDGVVAKRNKLNVETEALLREQVTLLRTLVIRLGDSNRWRPRGLPRQRAHPERARARVANALPFAPSRSSWRLTSEDDSRTARYLGEGRKPRRPGFGC